MMKAEIQANAVEELSPMESSNIYSMLGRYTNNNKLAYSKTGLSIKSYLFENYDKTFTRFECLNENDITIEIYSDKYELIDKKDIESELMYFDGFYCGELYNFIIFVDPNPSCSDNVEVMRVVKYSKDWEKLGSCSLYGLNTSSFGINAHMTEQSGNLFIHTCHTMYGETFFKRHQANISVVINEETMENTYSNYQESNLSTGYVSHSFDQYVRADNDYLYRLDLGDAAPRAIIFTKAPINKIYSCENIGIPIPGDEGDNKTGVTLGGFELSDDNMVFIGNSVDLYNEQTYDYYNQRNIFIGAISKDLETANVTYLTEYPAQYEIMIGSPKLVKINNNRFLIMWSENIGKTKYAEMDGKGNLVSEIKEALVPLSDCQPIVTSNGNVIWYVTDNGAPTFYEIDMKTLSIQYDISKSGQCGDDAYYTLDNSGLLTIYGAGALDNKHDSVQNNYYIKTVVIKEGITEIPSEFFNSCYNLSSVSLPNTLESIDSFAFRSCCSMHEINIPSNVNSIDTDSFIDSGVEKIIVEKNNSKYSSRDGVLFESGDDGDELFCYPSKKSDSSYSIPDDVVSIRQRAFACCYSLKEINIPSSVINIGWYAFMQCSKLESVNIADGVSSIDGDAFFNCSGLESIVIPDSVTYLGSGAFSVCENLKEVKLSENLTRINSSTFLGCAFSNIHIPESVTSIGWGAFCDCTNLAEFNVPANLVSIGETEENLYASGRNGAFDGTAWYKSQPDGMVYIGNVAYRYKGSMPDNTSIILDKKTIAIAEGAFSGCSNLTSIIIPKGVVNICEGAFRNCTGLTSVIIPDGTSYIGESAFSGCTNLASVKVPESVLVLGSSAFDDTELINSQNGIKYADTWVVECDKDISEINIRKGTTGIAPGAFYGIDFSEIIIPEGVKTIGEIAFADSQLASIVLPKSVQRIENQAFRSCNRLKSITIQNPECEILGDDRTICSYKWSDGFSGIIYGYNTSTAHEYAEKYGYKFAVIEGSYIKGDVNDDGEVTVADAILLQKWLLSESGAKLPNWKAADLYEDDRIDSFDMVQMRKLLIENK